MHYFSIGSAEHGRSYPLMHLNEMAIKLKFKHHAVIFWEDTTISRRTAWGSWLKASAPYISSPYEGMLVLYKEHWKKQTAGTTEISKEEFMEGCLGVWRISPAKKEKRKVNPAPFPIALADRAVRLFSYEGDTVLDPFVGSGTAVVAAVKAGRRGVGIDLNPKYARAAGTWVEEVL
jgi:site-specific DNA-methyltransferase (adenine-specific)